ncbi:hypothetical protein Ancab_008521 [Ancistrocladus abbreviatus]
MLKIFLISLVVELDYTGDFERVHGEMEESNICYGNSLRYETCAVFLEASGKLVDSFRVYQLGISRNAQPIERLKKALRLFVDRMSNIAQGDNGECKKLGKGCINPWSASTINDIVQKISPQLLKYDVRWSLPRGRKYQIKGLAGKGGFAQVYKAYVDSSPDDVVALKIQKPPFPWEFYMYCRLDSLISDKERSSFGCAQRMHHYPDYSILVCDYLSHGTLQDVINSYVVVGGFMEEVLCIYYTTEMLHILEALHTVGIIHGDFKPDNLLIRYTRDDLTDDEKDFRERSGPWHDQGLCLVDWGRGIDLSLFPNDTVFIGDCRTSGFRCVEMQENKPWKFQVDTYGLCVIVHMMLHGSYMEVEKKASSDGGCVYLPKSPFKRYWNVDLWRKLFERLLNFNPSDDHQDILLDLRVSFQNYMCSNPAQIKKLKQLLVKQRASLCSA